MYGEDIDLSLRITLGGYKITIIPIQLLFIIRHQKGSRNWRKCSRAMIIFANKHFSDSMRFIFFLYSFGHIFQGTLATMQNIQKLWLPLLDFAMIFPGVLLASACLGKHKICSGLLSRCFYFPRYTSLYFHLAHNNVLLRRVRKASKFA